MHKILEGNKTIKCQKCGKELAIHHYRIENRGYGSIFDNINGGNIEFYVCSDCNDDTLFYMVNENPIPTEFGECYLMERVLDSYLQTFPQNTYEQIILGNKYDTYKAYEQVGSFDSHTNTIYYTEEVEKELEEAYSQMSPDDWSDLYE